MSWRGAAEQNCAYSEASSRMVLLPTPMPKSPNYYPNWPGRYGTKFGTRWRSFPSEGGGTLGDLSL